jgi:hypothetical protein
MVTTRRISAKFQGSVNLNENRYQTFSSIEGTVKDVVHGKTGWKLECKRTRM